MPRKFGRQNLAFVLLFLGLASPSFGQSCNQANQCVGDDTWVFFGGALHRGRIAELKGNGLVAVATDQGTNDFDSRRIALAKADSCLPQREDACVGASSVRLGADGNPVYEKVIAVFSTGFVAVQDGAGTTRSLAGNQFQSFSRKACTIAPRFCEGDLAFADPGGGYQKVNLRVTPPNQVFAGDVALDAKSIAVPNADACAADLKGQKICPGSPVTQANGQVGTVLGLFPDSSFLIAGKDGIKRVSPAQVTLHAPTATEEEQIVEGLAAVRDIDQLLTAVNWADCSGLAPAIPERRKSRDGDPCNDQFGPISAEDSVNYQKFKDLLARGEAAPLEDFLMLWYPERGDGKGMGGYFEPCLSGSWGYLVPQANRFLSDSCSPDVLYSWGPMEKVNGIAKNAPDGGMWSGGMSIPPHPIAGRSPILYASLSAMATFPYGDVPIRIKFKPGTRFENYFSVETRPGEVLNYPWGQGSGDFYIGDSSVVDSWSFGTPEHYDEIVRDIRKVISGENGVTYTSPPSGTGTDRILSIPAYDGHNNSLEGLKRSLLTMVRMIVNKEGRIYYNMGVCRSRFHHFDTDKHSYMNP